MRAHYRRCPRKPMPGYRMVVTKFFGRLVHAEEITRGWYERCPTCRKSGKPGFIKVGTGRIRVKGRKKNESR